MQPPLPNFGAGAPLGSGRAIADHCFSNSAALPTVTSAQTAFGVLDVWLKKQESADAPNDQQITNSPALSIAMPNAYFSLLGLPSVAVVQRA
jgi:hypothetical protein